MLIKLAAAGGAAFGLYKIIGKQRAASKAPVNAFQPALATNGLGGPTTQPNAPVAGGGNYVSPT